MIDLTKSDHDYDHDYDRYGDIDYVAVDSETAAYRSLLRRRRDVEYIESVMDGIFSIARLCAKDLDVAYTSLCEVGVPVGDPCQNAWR